MTSVTPDAGRGERARGTVHNAGRDNVRTSRDDAPGDPRARGTADPPRVEGWMLLMVSSMAPIVAASWASGAIRILLIAVAIVQLAVGLAIMLRRHLSS